jgi:hypothetical protein
MITIKKIGKTWRKQMKNNKAIVLISLLFLILFLVTSMALYADFVPSITEANKDKEYIALLKERNKLLDEQNKQLKRIANILEGATRFDAFNIKNK